MFTSLIRKTSCAATLCLAGLLASNASAADVQFKGNHLTVKFDKQVEEDIQLLTAGLAMVAVVVDGDLFGIYMGVTNISVKGGPRDDTLGVSAMITGNLTIKSGSGDDDIYIGGLISRNVKVSLGAGDDLLEGDGTPLVVGGSYTANGGAGSNDFHFDDEMLISGNMSLKLGKGDPAGNQDVFFHLTPKTIQKTLSIKLSKKGDQDVVLEDLNAGKLLVRGSKSNNVLDLSHGSSVIDETSTAKVETTLLP
ncbi:MAG: hypothetical protein P8N09_09560 [Planctomycetota bacterium]|nr:hypothetical protein [Planctomycetota bacterium]